MLRVRWQVCLVLLLAASPARAQDHLKIQACRMENFQSPHYSCHDEVLDANVTAFVAVDFWKEGEEFNKKERLRAAELLDQARAHGFFVIHGAGDAVIRSKRYLELRAEVERWLGPDYCQPNREYGNQRRKNLYAYGSDFVGCGIDRKPDHELSEIVRPNMNREREFLVRFEDEFRYVLWRYHIKSLVYLGGDLDICMMDREYGIGALATTEGRLNWLGIFVLSDLVHAASNPTIKIDEDLKNEVLLKSMSFSKIRIVSTQSMVFK